jgi:hypothetical protein
MYEFNTGTFRMKTLEIPHTKMCKTENSTSNCSMGDVIRCIRNNFSVAGDTLYEEENFPHSVQSGTPSVIFSGETHYL